MLTINNMMLIVVVHFWQIIFEWNYNTITIVSALYTSLKSFPSHKRVNVIWVGTLSGICSSLFHESSGLSQQDIKAASLRTLTSIVHLERTPKLSNIIDCTGTASYHGFLPVLVRNCIQAMIGESQTCCGMSIFIFSRPFWWEMSIQF